jgi:hypothetical protein
MCIRTEEKRALHFSFSTLFFSGGILTIYGSDFSFFF